jgi:large repetitive protein
VPLTDPAFVVTYVDAEHGTSAPFSMPSGSSTTADSDGDGLADADEDIDGDGIISPGETDPANPDTDGDGLTDGEERLGIGRIETLIARGVTFANLDALDPANPDSDGDCLPDGLEVGLSKDEAEAAIIAMRNRPHYVISPTCRQILAQHNVLTLENALPYDSAAPASLDNIAILYDLDPSSVTDPTSRDTDSDGIMDGLEDVNFNGRRDKKEVAAAATTALAKAYDYSRPSGGSVLTTCESDQEGWSETDPARSDSDGDGLRDGDEQVVTGDTGELGANESSPLMCDTDDDGVPDGMEVRLGTYPNKCDSDSDGLADGIELGIIHPDSSKPECRGLQAAGTNYRRPSVLDPLNPDADGDGIPDGVEDLNHNGWVDGSESDPTMEDSDNDGVNDGVESTGDFDGDGLPDFDMRLIANGRECTPPVAIGDLDCDGIPNARDEDADNDGCPDAQEGGWRDSDGNGIPDMYDAGTIGCSASGGSGGGTALPSVGTGTEDDKKKEESRVPEWALDITRGGDCTLVPSHNASSQNVLGILLGIPLVIMYVFRRVTRAC